MQDTGITKNSRKGPTAQVSWLFVFILFYPLILFPGQLFYKPAIIDETLKLFVVENYLLLPKVIFLTLFSVTGLLITRRYWRFDTFTILLLTDFFLVVLSYANSRDDIAFIILGGQKRMDGLLYQTSLHIFAISVYFYIKNFLLKWYFFYFALLITAIIQSFLVFSQVFDIDFVGRLTYIEPIKIPAGTMTHPGFLIGWLLPIFILGASIHFGVPKRFLWFHASALILVFFSILSSGNRTAFYTILVLLLAILSFNRNLKTVFLYIGFFIVFICHSFLISPMTLHTSDVLNTRTLETRIQIWKLFFLQVGKIPYTPFVGGGGDAFRLSLLRDPPVNDYIKFDALESNWQNYEIKKARFIPEIPSRLSEIEILFTRYEKKKNVFMRRSIDLDKVHNLFLDRFISFGSISALIWAVLYLYPLLRSLMRFKDSKSLIQFTLILATLSLISYYIIWFPFLMSEPLHLIIVAVSWVFLKDEPKGFEKTKGVIPKLALQITHSTPTDSTGKYQSDKNI
jgi:hypothetical protein